ncbi:MAG TPA: hypothetical protein VF331_19910 [Polyangiales bacterium]
MAHSGSKGGSGDRARALVALALSAALMHGCARAQNEPAQGDAATTGSDAGSSAGICDGSDGIRLGMWSGGGFVSQEWLFMHPYGGAFAFVDGHCRFYASTNAMKSIATGSLTTAEAKQLATEIGWAQIDAFSRHEDASCPDAGASMISNGVHAFGCSCGCDANAPAGLAAAEAASHVWTKRLAEQGTALDGAVRATLEAYGDGVAPGTLKWPLTRSASDFISHGTLDASSGVVVDDTTQAAQLRMLRQLTLAQMPQAEAIQVDIGSSGTYTLLVRDELPANVATAVAAFKH